MNIQKVSVGKLQAAAYNPRKQLKPGDAEYEKLKRSITEFGYVEPVIWNQTTGNVVGGHQRLQVMKDLGYTEVDCVIVELDDQREKALNIALNKIQGEWDKDKLAALLTELDGSEFDVTMTGFDAAEVDELLNSFYSKEAVQDDFDVEEEHKEIKAKGAITKPGDIWKLGVHRLMCGDSTSASDFAKLMNGNRAQMSVTSPPYGVGKDYETKGIDPWFDTMRPVIENLTKNPNLYVNRCECGDNRPRGFLPATRGRIVIQNSIFHNMSAGVQFSGDANSWYEAATVEDVLIKGNQFKNHCHEFDRRRTERSAVPTS